MLDFGSILRRSRRLAKIKESGGKWGKCEECDSRSKLFPYDDEEKQVWMLCEKCVHKFVKDEK